MFSVQRHSCAYCDKPIQWPKIVNVTLLSPQKTSPPLQQRRKSFRERRSLEMRKMESLEVRTKFPKKIPVIVEKSDREKVLPYLDRVKFLVPLDMTMSQFVGIVRARLKLKSTQTKMDSSTPLMRLKKCTGSIDTNASQNSLLRNDMVMLKS
ncbi:hypothetical protein TNIN_187951 [Trichonephila inaurata madagascariensis]|uniref:Uncharacterized protein n=1 Tax=Trichonephila inaurata madagascariensis TaxID=2747483 RepID=A0A8X7C9S1_9ARAC|nr:hypothetical protein TNIN_187951 [Trichonephila inaurata madagascariensis]